MTIATMSWHVWECYLWKGLSDLQPYFGVPDPEVPASTPGDIKHSSIPKKWLRNSKLCLMHNFSTGCAFL